MIHSTKNTSTGHFGTRDDPAIRFRKFLDEMVIEATKVVEAVEVIEAAEVLRPGKSLLRASDSSRF